MSRERVGWLASDFVAVNGRLTIPYLERIDEMAMAVQSNQLLFGTELIDRECGARRVSRYLLFFLNLHTHIG